MHKQSSTSPIKCIFTLNTFSNVSHLKPWRTYLPLTQSSRKMPWKTKQVQAALWMYSICPSLPVLKVFFKEDARHRVQPAWYKTSRSTYQSRPHCPLWFMTPDSCDHWYTAHSDIWGLIFTRYWSDPPLQGSTWKRTAGIMLFRFASQKKPHLIRYAKLIKDAVILFSWLMKGRVISNWQCIVNGNCCYRLLLLHFLMS